MMDEDNEVIRQVLFYTHIFLFPYTVGFFCLSLLFKVIIRLFFCHVPKSVGVFLLALAKATFCLLRPQQPYRALAVRSLCLIPPPLLLQSDRQATHTAWNSAHKTQPGCSCTGNKLLRMTTWDNRYVTSSSVMYSDPTVRGESLKVKQTNKKDAADTIWVCVHHINLLSPVKKKK